MERPKAPSFLFALRGPLPPPLHPADGPSVCSVISPLTGDKKNDDVTHSHSHHRCSLIKARLVSLRNVPRTGSGLWGVTELIVSVAAHKRLDSKSIARSLIQLALRRPGRSPKRHRFPPSVSGELQQVSVTGALLLSCDSGKEDHSFFFFPFSEPGHKCSVHCLPGILGFLGLCHTQTYKMSDNAAFLRRTFQVAQRLTVSCDLSVCLHIVPCLKGHSLRGYAHLWGESTTA